MSSQVADPRREPPTPAEVDRSRPGSGRSVDVPALLLAATAGVVASVLARQEAPELAVGLLLAAAIAALAVFVIARRVRMGSETARGVSLGLTLTACAALVVALVVIDDEQAIAVVPIAAALAVAVSTMRGRAARWSLQLLLLAIVGTGLVANGRPLADIVLVVTLLASAAFMAEAFSWEMVRARVAEAEARRTAEWRTELLRTARELPGRSVQAAAEAVVATLRSLAFDAAGVGLVEGDRLVGIHLDGIPQVSRPVRRGEGVSWQAIEQGRTIVLDDYQQGEHRLDERPSIRSTVVTPIRVDGRPVGTVMCARNHVGPPSDAEVEIAEVLADHLGGVVAAARRRDRQRQLLHRVEELDRMRSGLVDAVSAELRDPLTIVRGIASILRVHGDRLPPGERRAFLDRLGAQTQDLRRVVDAILDFSRFQAKRGAADLQELPLVEVLAPIVGEDEVVLVPPLGELSGELVVRVDPQLIVFGLQLLTEARLGVDGRVHRVRLEVVADDEAVTLVRRTDASPPISELTVSLASQLLVAAGADVDADDEPRVRLPVADVEVTR